MGWIDALTGRRRKLCRTFDKMGSLFDEEIRKRILILKTRGGRGGGGGCSVQEDFLDVLLHLHAAEEDDQSLIMNEIKAILMWYQSHG
ncbi:hypothetical protein KSP40_PGU008480 [Platanthera guangdongensis]|uniref:Uncharacterized protein n=1 Tax=Platanthera guangdongensis TaxID=2320717 RepID=A0ABR2N027_9ASPA